MASAQPVPIQKQLKVIDSKLNNDNSVAYIRSQTMMKIGIFKGDCCFVQNNQTKKQTILVVIGQQNINQNQIALNQTVRKNIGVNINDLVSIKVANDLPYFTNITIKVDQNTIKDIQGQNIYIKYIKPYFKDSYRPLMKGDGFSIKGSHQSQIWFNIIDSKPVQIGIVGPQTIIKEDFKNLGHKKEQMSEQQEL